LESPLEERSAPASFITGWGRKAPLLPLETKFLGWPLALLRLFLVVLFALVIGISMDRVGGDKAAESIKTKMEREFS